MWSLNRLFPAGASLLNPKCMSGSGKKATLIKVALNASGHCRQAPATLKSLWMCASNAVRSEKARHWLPQCIPAFPQPW